MSVAAPPHPHILGSPEIARLSRHEWPGESDSEPPTSGRYVLVDSLPDVVLARQEVRDAAWATVRLRADQLAAGEHDTVPVVIDALSTADAVLEAEEQYGEDSREHQERLAGLTQDCERLVAEWWRKKKPEYFPPSRHTFDAQTEDFYSHGLSIRQMTENALRPIPHDPEEVDRRVNERVETETPLLVQKLGGFALGSAGIRTISECTDKAITDYQYDMRVGARHRGYSGYVPEIEKLMIRDTRLDPETGDRWQEQIGVPGIYINHWVIQEALRRRGVETGHMDKTRLHGAQILAGDDLMDFVALLDEVASEEWRANIFMGEVVDGGYIKDYANFRSEALRRQAGQGDLARKVVTFVLEEARTQADRVKAPARVEEFVKLILIDAAKGSRVLATQMFDEKTADGLERVAQLEAVGKFTEAFSLQQEVEKEAPGGGACSGGSCGLERVDLMTEDGQKLSDKLRAEPGDTIVRDRERTCKCGAKTIVYAYNKNKVNKYCETCHAFESKKTKKPA